MSFHYEPVSDIGHDGSAPPRVPINFTRIRLRRIEAAGAELLRLYEQREVIDRRLRELADILDPAGDHHTVRSLPKSGLTQAAPGVLLFKGGARG